MASQANRPGDAYQAFKRTIDRSSLGTPPARLLRARTSDEVVDRIQQRASAAAARRSRSGEG